MWQGLRCSLENPKRRLTLFRTDENRQREYYCATPALLRGPYCSAESRAMVLTPSPFPNFIALLPAWAKVPLEVGVVFGRGLIIRWLDGWG